MKRRKFLRKINDNAWIAGVCGGIAYAYHFPVVLVRIIFVVFVCLLTNPWTDYLGQILLWFYVLFWIFGPDWDSDPKDYHSRTG